MNAARILCCAIAALPPAFSCRAAPNGLDPADVQAGAGLISAYGCGSCHTIKGIPGARGLVGPPLDNIASRSIIGGKLPNTPEGMAMWLQRPQSVVPGNAMPDLGIDADQARAITAYLATLR